MWTDSHCHLDLIEQTTWDNALRAGVSALVIPGVRGITDQALRLSKGDPRIHAAAGWHPLFPPDHREQVGAMLSGLLDEHPLIRIVGEIGLDYWEQPVDRDAQRTLFADQLAVAAERNLPVIIHLRKAWDDFLAITAEFNELHFIMHMFGGSKEQVDDLLNRLPHAWFSFGGPATRENAVRARRTLGHLPPDRILLETDAPDLPPPGVAPPNTPANLPLIGEGVAAILDIKPAELAEQTSKNAGKAFKWTNGNGPGC